MRQKAQTEHGGQWALGMRSPKRRKFFCEPFRLPLPPATSLKGLFRFHSVSVTHVGFGEAGEGDQGGTQAAWLQMQS